ncbi:Germacrene-D synthase [Sesamum angolense]|uniref:Germacrene-D synthase n=1 Tax=Sesamum angolense TaxID=2727404 RepID=A0AAE1WSC0_9LAMI|nr:Germacrene-D synthase [Sesamum angolense]
MEFDSSKFPIFSKEVDIDEVRRSIKYHPSVWGEFFLTFASTEISTAQEEELQRQKNMVRTMLAQTPDDSPQKLQLIDVVQRLGVGYHFEEEIDKSLRYMHDTYLEYSSNDSDLRTIALRFRLLRQQGYPVSCDVFDKFLDGEGNFKESLVENAEGLLELYESSYFGVRGEEILDKAMEFSSSKLKWWRALDFANRLSFARDRVSECYFWIVEVYFEPRYHKARITLTKVLNLTSILDDVYDVYGTLDDLQLFTDIIQRWDANALEQLPPYLRICYEALSDVYIEMENEIKEIGESYRAQYAKEEMKKLLRAYLEETKWSYGKDIPTMEEYMKVAIVTATYMMLSTTSLVGMGNLVTKKDFDWVTSEPLLVIASSAVCRLTNDVVGYGMKKMVRAYLEEAKWCYNKNMPTMEEYMKVAIVTSTYMMLLTTSLVGMENLVTRKDFDWITSEPLLVLASSIIGRLANDMAGHGMKKLVRAYIEEAKWCYNKDMPTMEEYMKVAVVTSTYMMLSTTSLVGMGNLVTKKDFDWITSEPLLVLASSIIGRLANDLAGRGFEKKSTAVECYMKENSASKEEAFAELGNK